jgi:transposase
MRRPRRNHTAAFKAKVAVVALKGDKTLVELAKKFDVHANQITQWKTQLLEAATNVFLTPAENASLSGRASRTCRRKSHSWRWRMIFWPA